MAIENISQDLADLLATKDYEVKYTDGKGKDSSPEESKTFAFDWTAPSSGKNYGTVVIVLADDNDLQMFFGDNIGRTMENPQDKVDWFGSDTQSGFLPELKNFATQHRYTFSPKNINQLKHTMQGIAAIREGLFEGYYGTRRVSYMGEATEARLVIRHNRMIGEDDKRYRYVESLFIETADQERFKLPFTKLAGGRAMLEHVRQGGKPYDIRGQHIAEIVTEMAVLSRFNRASQQRVFEGVTQQLVETAQHYYQQLRESLQSIATGRGYQNYFQTWSPADIPDQTALVEDLKTMFIEQTLDARIEAALPTLAKLQQRGQVMKEAEIFENWANQVMEGTWALPDTPEAQAKLKELMSQELIVGPDAINATEQLYDVVGDDQLFDILSNLAENDPRANIWDDTDVQARLADLGIQTPQSTAAEPADVAQDQAPAKGMAEEMTRGERAAQKIEIPAVQRKQSGDPDWRVTPQDIETSRERTHSSHEGLRALQQRLGMTETAELRRMMELAQVPVAESRIHENSEYTYEIVAKTLAREKPGMSTDKNSPDFYNAVYHELIAIGMTPRASRNLISYDEDFINDVASAYAHYQKNPGLDESNSDMIMPEADPMDTFEVVSGFDAPVTEGSCNMTAEGEYCPEHGLAECGYMGEEEGFQQGAKPSTLTPGSTTAGTSNSVSNLASRANPQVGTVAGLPVNVGLQKGVGTGTGTSIGPSVSVGNKNSGPFMQANQKGAFIGYKTTFEETNNDSINRNDAITGSYNESQDSDALLARIKSLALLK